MRPYEGVAVEEFLDQLPKPRIEEIVEPEENRWIPLVSKQEQGTYVRVRCLPMEADAPESSPQGEASGVKAEPTEGSFQGEESETKDEHMGYLASEDSSPDEEHMPPDISPEKDDSLHDQGIWGRVETVVDPEAFKAATSAEEKNEKTFEKLENANDNKGLEHTEEFKYFCEVVFSGEERRSPMRELIEQKGGYSTCGLYHTGVRDELVSAFKVQHMAWRVNVDPHPMIKYTLSENDLFKHLCTMDPIYDRHPAKKDVVFRSEDVRSTLDDQLMEKASNVKRKLRHFQRAATQHHEKNS